MKLQGMIIIISMCGIILLLMAIKSKSELLLTGIFRGLLGSIAIVLANYLFQSGEFSLQIGMNPITILTCIFLGFPGLILVFAVSFLIIL